MTHRPVLGETLPSQGHQQSWQTRQALNEESLQLQVSHHCRLCVYTTNFMVSITHCSYRQSESVSWCLQFTKHDGITPTPCQPILHSTSPTYNTDQQIHLCVSQELLNLPEKISHSKMLIDFFMPRPGDTQLES